MQVDIHFTVSVMRVKLSPSSYRYQATLRFSRKSSTAEPLQLVLHIPHFKHDNEQVANEDFRIISEDKRIPDTEAANGLIAAICRRIVNGSVVNGIESLREHAREEIGGSLSNALRFALAQLDPVADIRMNNGGTLTVPRDMWVTAMGRLFLDAA